MILITGSTGKVGSAIKQYYPDAICPDRKTWDISQETSTKHFFTHYSKQLEDVDVIIHCAGLVNRYCDKDLHRAMMVNVQGTINVVSLCKELDAKLVYLSTEYIFNGSSGPYSTESEYRPINYYGETKLAGEFVVKCLPRYLILRISVMPDKFPFDSAFVDHISSKVPISVAAKRIADLIDAETCGVYHIHGKRQSIYDYAMEQGYKVKKTISNDGIVRPRDSSLC